MKQSKLRFFCAFAILISTLTIGSAVAQTLTPPSGPLYQEHYSKLAYFDSIHQFTPDSIFYHEGGEYAEYQKYFRFWATRLAPHGDMEVYDRLMRNYDQRQAHGAGSSAFRTFNEDPWLEIGPKRRTNNMIGIGPIQELTISHDPDYMLGTSISGGLFYTSDGATNWHNANTDVGWTHSGCRAAAFYPNTTDQWYAISSVGIIHGNKLSYTGGIYRTFNSSFSWDKVGDQADFAGTNTETHKLLFDKKVNGQGDHRLFLASTQGLFFSDNPAELDPQDVTWSEVLLSSLTLTFTSTLTNATVDPIIKCYDIEYLATSGPTSTLGAAMQFKVSHVVANDPLTSFIWRFMISLDDGDTWSEIVNQPPIDESISFATIETSAVAPTSFYCLALRPYQPPPDELSWVRVFDTALNTWAPLPVASGFTTIYGAGNAFGVNPTNANSVFVAQGTKLRRYDNGIISSVDNGHDDVEDVVGSIDQLNTMWVANHGGVSKITLSSGSTSSWADKSNGLGIGEVDAISTSETNPAFIVTGLFHDCATMTRTPYSPNWQPDWDMFNFIWDGTRCWVSRQDPNTVYSSGQNGNWYSSSMAETSNSVSSIWISSQWWSEGAIDRLNHDRIFRATKRNNGNYTYYVDDGNGNQVAHTHTNIEMEIARSENRGVTNTIISDFANTPEICAGADYINGHLYTNDAN